MIKAFFCVRIFNILLCSIDAALFWLISKMSPEDFWNGPTLPMTSLFLDKSYENFGVSRLGAGTVCFRNISSFILAIVLFARRAVALQRTVWGISCLVLLHLLAMIQACSHHSAIIVKSQWPTQANHIAIYFHKKTNFMSDTSSILIQIKFNPYSIQSRPYSNPYSIWKRTEDLLDTKLVFLYK